MRISFALSCLVLPVFVQGAYAPRLDLEEGRFLKAMTEAEAQLKQNPNNALAWAAKAHALSALLRFPEALDAAGRALALNPNLAEAYLSRGLARGGYAIQQRNFGSLRKATGALDDLRRATDLDPTLATAWMSLGLAYQQMPGILGGSTRKALMCASSLKKINPARGAMLQGMILSLEKRWNDAEPSFAQALAKGSSDPQVVAGYLDSLGSRETRDVLGERVQKERLVSKSLQLLPSIRTRAKGVEAVSEALLEGGEAKRAWDIAEEHLHIVEAPSLLRLQLGKIAAKSGINRPEGLTQLNRVLSENLEGGSGGIVSAWWRKGQILKGLGRIPEAREAAITALSLDPNHRGARGLLEELSK